MGVLIVFLFLIIVSVVGVYIFTHQSKKFEIDGHEISIQKNGYNNRMKVQVDEDRFRAENYRITAVDAARENIHERRGM